MPNAPADDIEIVLDYHQRTKHHLNRFAPALGYMDWANQPNPFRQFHDTPRIDLAHGNHQEGPLYRALFEGSIFPSKINFESISRLFYYSMALSARKQIPGGNGWSLRVNPSSGNLHPTESYLIIGEQASPEIQGGLYHYLSYLHTLEQRRAFDASFWDRIEKQIGQGQFLMGLTSIYWRETWKYGERGFRYCHHDTGHAIGAIAIAAMTLGWHAEVVETITDNTLAVLLGCENQNGPEAEHVDCLIMIHTSGEGLKNKPAKLKIDEEMIGILKKHPCIGKENQLSDDHHDWPIIETVSDASRKKYGLDASNTNKQRSHQGINRMFPASNKTAFQLIRQRRSAVAMDGVTTLEKSDFYGMMQRLQPDENSDLFASLSWAPNISLFLFVHRIPRLPQGLYVLIRNEHHYEQLKSKIEPDFLWKKPDDCPSDLSLYLLLPKDLRPLAKKMSCGQDIAADGVFSLGMLAHFEPVIRKRGAHFYPRLFWEAGLIGQLLYLEAEAAGIRSTGIGCFFDDIMHDILGIRDQTWQSLYHFTVGGPKEDDRLQTLSAYRHLQ